MALLSTNPFLNNQQKTGGTTTSAFAPNQPNNTGTGTPTPTVTGFSSSSTGQPVATTSSMGTTAKSPMLNLQPQSNTLPSNQAAKTSTMANPNNTGSPYGVMGTSTNNARSGGVALPQGYKVGADGSIVPDTGLAPSAQSAPNMQYAPTAQNLNPYTSQAPNYGGLIGTLANTAAAPSQAFQEAQKTASQALQDLQTSRTNEANALSLNSQNPIPLEFQQGRGRILQDQYLQQQNAYAQTYQGATAQEQAATGQQTSQQQGLGAAAGLAAPQQVNPTNVPFNPVTGQYENPAANAFGGGNGLQAVGNISGQIGVGQNIAQLNSQLGGAQVVGNNLQNLITSAGINPSGLSVVNGLLQFGAQQLGNAQYQEFQGQINDFINSIAPILGGASGATTDYKTQLAGQVVNALASGQNINQVVSYFLQQAQQKIQGMSSGGGAGVGSTGGSNTGNGATFGSFFGK